MDHLHSAAVAALDVTREPTAADWVEVRHDLSFSEAKQQAIRDFEVLFLRRLIKTAKGNVSRAARLAKMDRMYLHRLLGRHAEAGGLREGERGDHAE